MTSNTRFFFFSVIAAVYLSERGVTCDDTFPVILIDAKLKDEHSISGEGGPVSIGTKCKQPCT